MVITYDLKTKNMTYLTCISKEDEADLLGNEKRFQCERYDISSGSCFCFRVLCSENDFAYSIFVLNKGDDQEKLVGEIFQGRL